jgi:hypothetical protein
MPSLLAAKGKNRDALELVNYILFTSTLSHSSHRSCDKNIQTNSGRSAEKLLNQKLSARGLYFPKVQRQFAPFFHRAMKRYHNKFPQAHAYRLSQGRESYQETHRSKPSSRKSNDNPVPNWEIGCLPIDTNAHYQRNTLFGYNSLAKVFAASI